LNSDLPPLVFDSVIHTPEFCNHVQQPPPPTILTQNVDAKNDVRTLSSSRDTVRDDRLTVRKPKNARVKRALEKREPQVIENEKTAIFVRGQNTSEKVRIAMKDLVSFPVDIWGKWADG
jgi:hypothetical protein